jgi:hypothetical protein
MPQLDESDSFLSYNTTATTSDPSQIPLPTFEPPTSSLYNLPKWQIPITKLTSLDTLISTPARRNRDTSDKKWVNVIVCVVGVDRPKLLQRKEEKAKGREGTLWVGKWDVVGPGENGVREVGCEIKLWDSFARDWGDEIVKKGDVVLLESVSSLFELAEPRG